MLFYFSPKSPVWQPIIQEKRNFVFPTGDKSKLFQLTQGILNGFLRQIDRGHLCQLGQS